MRSLLLKPTNAPRGRKNHEMTKSIETIRASLANDLVDAESAIRADEREKATQEATRIWRGYVAELEASYAKREKEWGEKLLRIFEDRSGEDTSREQVKNPRKLCKGHYRIIAELKRDYTTTPMLRGLLGYSQHTLMTYMNDIRRHGYQIETKRSGRSEYRKLYRLAS